MAEEAEDVKSEITLDDFNADEQDTAKTESSPVKDKPKEPEKAKAEPKVEDKPEEKPEKKDTEGEKEDVADDTAETSPEETPEEEKPSKAEERKTQLNTEIRDLVAQRKALHDEVTKANAEVYATKGIEELKDEGLSETDAKVEALRQQVEMDKYNTSVAEAQLTIESESSRVLNDFPIFNPDNESFDKELAEEAAELLQSNLIVDENTGQVIGSNVSPYQLYKTIARAAGVSSTKGQIKGQQATEKMMANADPSTGAAPPAKVKDELMELWTSDD